MTGQRQTQESRIDREWWKEAVVYQIYPRSFADSDGDGVGDIPGITERVDYLDELGVDVVWLSPVYDSPNHDNGYDIRDYRAINEEFGDMADWEALRDELHDRDMKLIMDLVVNHTSNEHEWFQRSRREEGEYADYYHWVEGEPDEPPNNWESLFGGSAWSWDDEREAWYLHVFNENQPDLNWRNPDVREAVKDIVTWWVEKGIDGFRMDAISHLSKREGYPDGDPDEEGPLGSEHYTFGPRLGEYLDELGAVVPEAAMSAGEMGGADADDAREFVQRGDCLDMVFHFDHLDVDQADDWTDDNWGEWSLPEFKELMTRNQREVAEPAWEALFLGNHDHPRIVSRFGDDSYRRRSAKCIATFLLTMRGTPYLYQGQELGMTNTEFESLEEIDDVMTVGLVEDMLDAGTVDAFDDVREAVNYRSRDHARTPMHWSDDERAGFTDGEPWLPVNDNYTEINAAAARADDGSVFHHYRRLIDLRDDDPVFVYGDYDPLVPDDEQFFAFTRTLDGERRLVVCNWSDERATFEPGDFAATDAEVLLANCDDPPADPVGATFRPFEAVVYAC
ncbi:glycoside hydrolase family 13 protein [Halosimplex halophilum]|uniref:glycoside hydrolase family 13 protein n=1 Tax=Halosimplex halophilum TaxID=2559572 RepID=UPI00107F738C|nr:alpha-glucosidase [Halosimplex halophilum]